MKIYTKLGDDGFTSLQSGERVRKDDFSIEVLGELDELNCHIGLLITYMNNAHDIDFLYQLQNLLFLLSANLQNEHFSLDEYCMQIEHEIDTIQNILPDIHCFLLPGGSQSSAHAHICRCICRKVERKVVSLLNIRPIHPKIIQVLNRISDYFYVLARKINFENGISEKKWQNTCK